MATATAIVLPYTNDPPSSTLSLSQEDFFVR